MIIETLERLKFATYTGDLTPSKAKIFFLGQWAQITNSGLYESLLISSSLDWPLWSMLASAVCPTITITILIPIFLILSSQLPRSRFLNLKSKSRQEQPVVHQDTTGRHGPRWKKYLSQSWKDIHRYVYKVHKYEVSTSKKHSEVHKIPKYITPTNTHYSYIFPHLHPSLPPSHPSSTNPKDSSPQKQTILQNADAKVIPKILEQPKDHPLKLDIYLCPFPEEGLSGKLQHWMRVSRDWCWSWNMS